ncbi:hypothetical protein Q094_04458 [Pseudomonas aeruginosa PS42]|nr:hypothetical protein Q094_04458 [Pseudomonas aeruginosa PS42]
MERFFRSPKAERLYLTHYTSNQNAKSDLLDCIYLYNHLRRHSILGNLDDPRPLWRLSLPALAPETPLPGRQLLDWGGALRWLKSDAPAADIRAWAAAHGGHATCYRAGHLDAPFQPLPPGLLGLHRALKRQLDPQGIFNPGRMYAEL